MDDSTTAAWPTRVPISPRKFAAYFARDGLHGLALAASARAPEGLVARWRALAWVPGLGPGLFLWAHTREHLGLGALTPVVVLDASRKLCAAYTSLTRWGNVPTPVVKVFRERPELASRERLANGDRLAASSVFWPPRDPRSPCWADFLPRVVDCFSEDRAACAAARERVPRAMWTELFAGLRTLGTRRQEEGLHFLDPASAMAFRDDGTERR